MSRKHLLDRQGKLMVVGSVAVLGAILLTTQVIRPPKLDAENCSERPRRGTVILLDHTDSVASQTRAEILSRAVAWAMDSVATGERVSIFAIEAGSRTELVPRFISCKLPESGNELYQDDRRIRARFGERFEQPVRAMLDRPLGRSTESPIAQSIIDLSLSRYLSPSDTVALLLFSDLMENTSGFSLYSCTNPAEAVQRFRGSRQGAQERPSFRGLRVYLHIVPRVGLSRDELRCREYFWQWFFGDNGGADAALTPMYLPGGQR